MSREAFDYIVVGSGAAGASAARVLADTGRSVAVVEEGPEVSTGQFEDRALPTFARLYRERGAQITTGRAPVLIIQGRCVGGSTVVNSAIMRRLPEEVWDEWSTVHGLNRGLSYPEIDHASTEIESELRVEPTPEPIWGGNNRLLRDASARLGIAGSPTHRNAPGCQGSARCNLGCPHGAKQSMQLSYLPYSVAHGAEVMHDEHVVRITWQAQRATGIQTAKRRLTATRAVIVAASAVQSPGILARSGVRSRHLGRHFQGHPGMAVVGLFDRRVGIGDGATQGFEVDGLRADADVKLETLAVPPETFFGGMPGVGSSWLSLMGQFDHAAVWVLPLRARTEGRVWGRGEQSRIAYRLQPPDMANLRRGVRGAAKLMFEAGAGEVVCPVHGLPDRLRPDQLDLISSLSEDPAAYPLAMSHLFGTARMNVSSEGGVVGIDFRVHGTDNLYVVDSSVFPTNLGVNPQLTIMALARIAARRIAA